MGSIHLILKIGGFRHSVCYMTTVNSEVVDGVTKLNQHINQNHPWLVVSNIFNFQFHIWDVILPIDELTFFKMGTLHHQADQHMDP